MPWDTIDFPAVLKPSGRRESSGVRAVDDREQLEMLLTDGEYHEAETLLIEERISGAEFSVEALVQRGRVVFESVTQKGTNENNSDRFVELVHTVPAPHSPGNDRLLAANRDILERLGFENGIVHTELKLTDDGRAVLMEVAARTPGDGLLPLYHLATGRPMEPDILRIALGEPVEYPKPTRWARQVYVETAQGVLDDVKVLHPQKADVVWRADGEPWPDLTPGDSDEPASLRAVLALKRRGSLIGPLNESGDRVVTFLIDGRSIAEIDALEAEIRESIDVSIAPPKS